MATAGENLAEVYKKELAKTNVVTVDDTLALEAMQDNIIVEEDPFKTGYECKDCDGVGHLNEICWKCKGALTIESPRRDEGLVPCGECIGRTSAGSLINTGFRPCKTCKGVGGSIVVPDEAIRRPSSGIIRTCGADCKTLKNGDRVLYTSYIGHAIDFKRKGVLRVMHEHEIIAKIYGVGKLGDKIK